MILTHPPFRSSALPPTLLRRAASLLLTVLAILGISRATLAYSPPPLSGPVTDLAGVLAPADKARIEGKLRALKGTSGPQLAVLILPSLGGETVEDVAYATAKSWKLGDAVRDDGVLLLVATGERKIRIETGKGVGGALPDLAANRIIKPYSLDVKEVVWWSIYDIGHSITDKFDNVGDDETRNPRVFTAGDACHTHSPKAGQGMNVSMQDTFNLGWKLAAVLRGQCPPQLLHTYTAERQSVGNELIEFDREWARMISDKPAEGTGGSGGVDPKAFQAYFEQHLRFTAGMGTRYQPSIICGDSPSKSNRLCSTPSSLACSIALALISSRLSRARACSSSAVPSSKPSMLTSSSRST